MALCLSFLTEAQNLPYSKYLNFSKAEFKENNFKYNEKTNTWYINKVSGLNTTLNILAIIADASEDVRPDIDDYSIIVQFGKEDVASCVRVIYYNDETYHKILAFIKANAHDVIDVYEDYSLELTMEQNIRYRRAY